MVTLDFSKEHGHLLRLTVIAGSLCRCRATAPGSTSLSSRTQTGSAAPSPSTMTPRSGRVACRTRTPPADSRSPPPKIPITGNRIYSAKETRPRARQILPPARKGRSLTPPAERPLGLLHPAGSSSEVRDPLSLDDEHFCRREQRPAWRGNRNSPGRSHSYSRRQAAGECS